MITKRELYSYAVLVLSSHFHPHCLHNRELKHDACIAHKQTGQISCQHESSPKSISWQWAHVAGMLFYNITNI